MATKNVLLTVNQNNFLIENVRKSFKDSCRRWQCKYTEVTESVFDCKEWHAGSLKLKAFEICPDADQIFVIDADAIIRSDTPSPFDMRKPGHIMAVTNYQEHFPPAYKDANPKIEVQEIGKIFVRYPRINFDYKKFINSGVVLLGKEHAPVLKRAAEIFTATPGLQWWDQSPLNYAIQESNTPLQLLPIEWNHCLATYDGWMQSYIIHFAGQPGRYVQLPNMHWYAAGPGENNMGAFFTGHGCQRGAEIGVQEGQLSARLLKEWKGHLIMVDCWRNQDANEYFDIANVADHKHGWKYQKAVSVTAFAADRSTVINDFSVNAAKQVPDNSLDFVYIDANHSYEAVKDDLEAWYPKVKSGGIISGHDFLNAENNCGSRFGVQQAVEEFIANPERHITSSLWVAKDNFPQFHFFKP